MKISLRLIAATFTIVFIATLALTTQTSVNASSTGAAAGYSGSPADAHNCTYCHSGTPKTASGFMTSNVPTQGYMPGSTYTITATLASSTVNRYGFEISPQSTAGTLLGSMIITDPTRTKLTGTGSKWITHTSSGIAGVGGITWSFNWVAPVGGTGAVTFYGAFNFTNSNGSDTGDTIKVCQLKIVEDTGAGVDLISEEQPMKVWPNPVSDVAHIGVSSAIFDKSANDASLRIFDSAGRIVQVVSNFSSSQMDVNLSGMVSGIYYVSLSTKAGSYSYKLIKL